MNKFDDDYIKMMMFLEWKDEVNKLQKKFDDCEKRKKGYGVL